MTTDTTTAVEAGDEKSCPKCQTGKREDVPETSIWHCDSCGATGDYENGEIIDPSAKPPEAAVQPDEIIGDHGDVPSNALPVLRSDENQSGLVHGLSIAPSPDEWERMTAMAVVMSASKIVPRPLQGKPHDTFVVLWTGRDLGIPVTTALRNIHVIEGTPSLSPKLRIARVHMLGLGNIVPDPMQTEDVRVSCTALALTNDKCNVCKGAQFLGMDKDTLQPIPCDACRTTGYVLAGRPYTYNWDMAADGGMVQRTCSPGNHTCRGDNKCKANWKQWPDRMLWWRAGGYQVDTYFPEAGMGLYSPDELGGVTDEEGQIIDVNTVELPKGYENVRKQDTAQTPATEEQITDLKARVRALPDEQRNVFLGRWAEKAGEGRIPEKVDGLMASQVAIATALVSGAEAEAKSKGWKPPEQGAPTGNGAPPPDAAGAPGSPATTDPPPGAQNEPQALTREQQLDLQKGNAEPMITDDIIDRARAQVEAMTSREIGDELRTRGYSTGGNAGHRHDTLGRAIAKELAAADHAEANLAS